MEYRKTEKSNLENKKGIFFLVGALLIITVTYASFNIKSYEKTAYNFEMQVDEEMMELPPVTTPPPPPPPPPPPAAPPVQPEIKLVEDNVKTEDPKIDDTDITEVEVNDAPPGPSVEEPQETLEDVPMTFVSNMPTLPECAGLKSNFERDQCTKNAIVSRIFATYQLPEIARELGQEGTIWVKFIVDKNGNVSSVEVIKSLNEHADKEAIRAVKLLPKFTPGMNLDRPVPIMYNIPIKITISE